MKPTRRVILFAKEDNIGTSGSSCIVCPVAGEIAGLAAMNIRDNAGGAIALTAKIRGIPLVHPAWNIAAGASAYYAAFTDPTDRNIVAAGDVLEIEYNGGDFGPVPARFTVTLLRSL